MAYRVEIAQAAEAELEALYVWVVSRAPSQGAAWFNGLERAVLALNEHPERCQVAPESPEPERPVRVLRYGRKPHIYLVFFSVDTRKRVVRVLHVRRGTSQPPTLEDLKESRDAK